MREINQSEMSLVAGGFVPAVVAAASAVGTAATTGVGPYVFGAGVGAGIYAGKQTYYSEPITATGSTVGQALWQANFVPISMAGQEIASNY